MRPTPSIALALTALVALPLAGCGGDDTATDAPIVSIAPADVAPGLVDPATAAGLAASSDVTVIDVRTPEEFAEGHLEGAQLIDIYEADFAQQIDALDRDGDYLVYCRSGNRSASATALMAQLGFTTVFELEGGMVAYDAAGLPVVS